MQKRTLTQPPLQNITQPPSPKPSYAMDADIGDFLLDRRVNGVSPKTLRWYQGALAKFKDYCVPLGVYRLSDITPRVLRFYLAYLEEAGHNPGGISNLYRALRAFLRWSAEEFEQPALATAIKKVAGPTPSIEPLEPISLQDVSAMIAQCTPRTFTGERDKAILLVLLDTGIRHQELTNLTVNNVKIDAGTVLIHEGKGGKSRTVFIGLKARRAMINYMRLRDSPMLRSLAKRHSVASPDALWLTDEGTPLTKSGIRHLVKRRAAQAGLPEPGLHEFRRAFAVNSLRNGMDVITLQRLLGHSTLAIINRYLKLLSDDLKASHEKYGVVDRL